MNENSPSMLDKVNKYIEYRRGLGYKLHTDVFLLRSFAEHADRHAPGKPLTVEIAIEWATNTKTKSRTYPAKRLDVLRVFARYLAAFEPGTEIPPGRILGPSTSRVTPHIYTDKEITAMMRAAAKIKSAAISARTNPLRNSTMIGLLACTGMRIGEVLALENRDVNLDQGIIMVRESKNLPMRMVPITDCAVRHLCTYKKARDRCFGPATDSGAFFMSCRGGRLSPRSFFFAFDNVRERAGLNHRDSSGRRPRIHDLRHTFACNHLLRAYRENRDVDDAVQDLSVYLGHVDAHATYWYLTAIPELLEHCVRRFENQFEQQKGGGGL